MGNRVVVIQREANLDCLDYEVSDMLAFRDKMRLIRKLGGYGRIELDFHEGRVKEWNTTIRERSTKP